MKYSIGDICVVRYIKPGKYRCSNFEDNSEAKYVQIKTIWSDGYIYKFLDDNLKPLLDLYNNPITCDCLKDKHLDYYSSGMSNIANSSSYSFKIGDEVEIVFKHNSDFLGIDLGEKGIIVKIQAASYYVRFFSNCAQECDYLVSKKNIKLITSNELNKLEDKPMETLKKFIINVLTKEPMKSYRKAGIIDGENIITDAGVRVFLTWFISHDLEIAKAFKFEVVDEMLKKEDKKDKDNN